MAQIFLSDLAGLRLYRGEMSMTDSQELLREYVSKHSEAAFEQLVRRYIDLVYSVALRRVNWASQLAQDVAQVVFTDLARKAASLPDNVTLGGWLHHHTCFVASSALRGEQRRVAREKQAFEMNALFASEDSDWKELAPVLDESMDRLEPADRDALVLRFFERRDLRSVGAALGASEDAAQKRVSRALEKLRSLLVARGVTLSLAALGTVLGARAVEAAPHSLAGDVSKSALSAGAAGFVTGALLRLAPPAMLKLALAALVAGLGFAGWAIHRRSSTISTTLPSALAEPAALVDAPQTPAPLLPESASVAPALGSPSSNALHLVLVAADSGKPVPAVQIDYRGFEGEKFSGKTLTATRFGICDVEIPRGSITKLELTTRIDGFADTRLHWEEGQVKAIPFNYTLRLVRPVPIGGRVLDPDGQPVAGAKVGFNHRDDPSNAASPEDHFFSWIQVSTDSNGTWRIDRVASEMLRLLYGGASHPDYVESEFVFLDQNPEAEQKFKNQTFMFHLGRAVTARGTVIDPDGAPIAGAKVLVGKRGSSDSRSAKTQPDGSFVVAGCRPGKSALSAEAEGFAPTTMEVEFSPDSQSFRLTLQRGKLLLLRLLTHSGRPVSKAHVWLDTMNQVPLDSSDSGKVVVQANFDGKPDTGGRTK
ncbi:MAG TPA: sigma-70 family RNA polymerase sigma factor [Verrucomicrobiae bacterium]|nr:sigma-70 family RNA polymerase sigma factor [Verrucomicrobiae bacterium]